jgi:hypothetical protein
MMRVRRTIAILLLGVFLSNTMEGHEFLKLPALFKHMAEHRADGPMGWSDFFAEHYFDAPHHPDRGHHHNDLPFHADNHCCAQTVQARLPEAPSGAFAILQALDRCLKPVDEDMPDKHGTGEVWQPPRA